MLFPDYLSYNVLLFRSVLLRRSQPTKEAKAVDKTATAASTDGGHRLPPPTPTRMANSSTVAADGTERGDLIMFYNTGEWTDRWSNCQTNKYLKIVGQKDRKKI